MPVRAYFFPVQEHFEREAARFAVFDNDDDMFADDDNAENKPELASTSIAPSFPTLLSTPRVSFSFPDVRIDSNGGTPRLHPASSSHSPQLPQQEAQQEAQNNSTANGDRGRGTFSCEETNGHAENGTSHQQEEAHPSGEPIQPSSGAPQQAEVDYQSWPVKELRRFLSERGVVRACCPIACQCICHCCSERFACFACCCHCHHMSYIQAAAIVITHLHSCCCHFRYMSYIHPVYRLAQLLAMSALKDTRDHLMPL